MLAVKRVGRDLWHARSGCDSFCLEEDVSVSPGGPWKA